MFKFLSTYIFFLAIISCTTDGLKVIEPVAPTPQYTLSVTAGLGGTVSSSGGVYAQETPLSITATPNSGFTFNSWSNGSTANPISILLNSNTTISASFVAIPPTYSVALTAGEGGSVSGGGSYQQGTQVTLSATPNTGYVFLNWSDGSTDQNRSISVSQNLTLTANFEIITYTLTINAGSGGFVSSSGGTFDYGAQVTLSATPSTGYVFSSWSDGSIEQSRTITISQNTTLTANFVENSTSTYTLTVNAGTGGSVSSSGGTYDHGDQVTLSATPNSGYVFSSWSDGSTDQNITITISQNTTLTANFVQNTETTTPSYILSVSATNGGSVNTSGGEYAQGTSVTITATPSSGYTFTGWSGNATGTSTSLSITINGNTSVTANFEIITYTLTVNAGTGGSVSSSGGTYDYGAQVTLSATPNTGYEFSSWSDGSTQQSRTITMSQNTTLTANFVENTQSSGSTTTSYTLSVSATNGGSVNTSGGEYTQGTSVTITATANSGYTFTGWSGNATGTSTSLSITINGNTSVTANFEIITYTLTVNSGSGGSVSSNGGSYNSGQQVTITATPNTGYSFSSWSDGSTQQSRTITMSQNTTLTANFEIITYTLTVNAGTGGSVSSSGGTYNSGQQVTITATPNTGYNFVNWSGGSSSDSSQITITMNSNTVVTANFEQITYTLTVNSGSGGSVSSNGGTYNSGQQVTITATPNTGYSFVNWSGGSSSDSSQITITMNSNTVVTANFEQITYTLTVNAGTGGSVYKVEGGNISSISFGGGTYNSGQQVTITATPNTGYSFVNWSDGSTDSSRTITMSENTTLTANFETTTSYIYLDSNGVTVKASPGGAIGSQETLNGNTYTIVDRATLISKVNAGENVSYLVTSYITNMSSVFESDEVTGDISSWDVSNVTNMGRMFYNSQFNGDISSWNVSNVTNMEQMFFGSSFNQSIGNWNVSSVTNMYQMFMQSSFNKDIGNWNVSSVTNMHGMFLSSSFNKDIGNWNVSNVTTMEQMFFNNSSFNKDIGNWNVSNVTTMRQMFYRASFNKDIGNWNVSNVTTMEQMFWDSSFNSSLANWNPSSVTNMELMFYSTPFNQPIGDWDVSSVTNMYYMFGENLSFNQDLSSWDVSSVTNMSRMFQEATSFNQDISSWDVSNVTSMDWMLSLTPFNQDISSWDVSNVTDMRAMFQDAGSFNQDISSWDISNVTDMYEMFSGASSFNQDLSGWDLSGVSTCQNFSGSGYTNANTPMSWETSKKPDTSSCGG